MNTDIRILIIHDQEIARHGLQSMLELENMQAVGECDSAEEACDKVKMLHPDIVLIHAVMPGMNGIEATRNLTGTAMDYDGDIIVLDESPDHMAEALEAGATCYLLADVKSRELADAIKQVFWNKCQLAEFAEEAVELVIPLSANAAQVMRFMSQIDQTLHDNYGNAEIVHTVGSWNQDTVITIRIRSVRLSRFLDELGHMPNVEKVEEQPLPRFANKFRWPRKLGISPIKRVRVTLEEIAMVGNP